MKLSEIKQLSEAYRASVGSIEEAWDILETRCSDALKTFDAPIVRGMPEHEAFQIITGEDGKRKSRNTTNHYTVILDEVLPKEFPKRSGSIICTNFFNAHYADQYGGPHYIFPFNGVKIGVCPNYDMWVTPIELDGVEKTAIEWNEEFKKKNITAINYETVLRGITEHADAMGIDRTDIDEMLRDGYTKPFEVTTTANPIYNDGKKHELWIGGSCLVIDYQRYRKMKMEFPNRSKHETE